VSKTLAKKDTGSDLGFLSKKEVTKVESTADKGATVSLIAVTCVHYDDNGNTRVALPKEAFKVAGTKGNPKLDIKPTTARQEADRLVDIGRAVGL